MTRLRYETRPDYQDVVLIIPDAWTRWTHGMQVFRRNGNAIEMWRVDRWYPCFTEALEAA